MCLSAILSSMMRHKVSQGVGGDIVTTAPEIGKVNYSIEFEMRIVLRWPLTSLHDDRALDHTDFSFPSQGTGFALGGFCAVKILDGLSSIVYFRCCFI